MQNRAEERDKQERGQNATKIAKVMLAIQSVDCQADHNGCRNEKRLYDNCQIVVRDLQNLKVNGFVNFNLSL